MNQEAEIRGLASSIVNDKAYALLKLQIIQYVLRSPSVESGEPINGPRGALKAFDFIEELARDFNPREFKESPQPKKKKADYVDPDLDDSPREE